MKTTQKLLLSILFCLTFALIMNAQNESKNKNVELGIEIQAYPTGVIPGIRIEKFLNEKTSLNLRIGYQFIDHRDLGVQENEKGSGFGASLAYRRFFGSNYTGFSLAFRTDLWFNKMDWEDGNTSGTTNLTIIQPTLMGEYAIEVSPSFYITPSLAFGWEWNVITDGEPTGEGAIILVGCTFGFPIH